MTILIKPYNKYSKSARALARGVGGKILVNKIPSRNDLVVNWGCSNLSFRSTTADLNHPSAVSIAVNKLKTLNTLADKPYCLQYTTDKYEAKEYLANYEVVYARQHLTKHSGCGIILCIDKDEIPDAPLYTVGFNSTNEYRVHVFKNKVIDIQEKRKRRGVTVNRYVRNHKHGWVFCRQNIDLPDVVAEAALDAVATVGLDFGGLDIGYNKHTKDVKVYEINTAVGIEKTTVDNYVNAIRNYYYAM